MKTVRLTAEQYPKLLKEIEDPPEYLDCAGAIPLSSDEYKYLCVVGARRYSEYGRDACVKLISGLKNYPIIIVSGLALGIDSIAHAQALRSGLKTLAFPGSGLSETVLAPATHLKLARKIVTSGGTLLSPFEYYQPGDKWTFPVRNRYMAGISHATLLIEGCKGSGTLITANHALEFNRDLMIVPGSIFSDLSYGPHTLFHDGATPVFSSEDILAVLGFDVNRSGPTTGSLLDLAKISLSPDEQKIIRELQFSPMTSSQLIQKTELSASQFNILASQLELSGLIAQCDDIFKIQNL